MMGGLLWLRGRVGIRAEVRVGVREMVGRMKMLLEATKPRCPKLIWSLSRCLIVPWLMMS